MNLLLLETENRADYRWEIKGKPIAQSRPRFARMGKHVRVYDPAEVMDYKSLVKSILAQNRPPEPLDGALELEIVFGIVKPKSWSKKRTQATTKPDLDNLAKLVMDCLESVGIYRNDAQIVTLHIEKRLGDNYCTHIHLVEVEG